MLFHYFHQQNINGEAKRLPLRQRAPFPVGRVPVDEGQWDKYMLTGQQLQTQTYEARSLIIRKKRNAPRTMFQPSHFEMCPYGGPVL